MLTSKFVIDNATLVRGKILVLCGLLKSYPTNTT